MKKTLVQGCQFSGSDSKRMPQGLYSHAKPDQYIQRWRTKNHKKIAIKPQPNLSLRGMYLMFSCMHWCFSYRLCQQLSLHNVDMCRVNGEQRIIKPCRNRYLGLISHIDLGISWWQEENPQNTLVIISGLRAGDLNRRLSAGIAQYA
jgi:hypothetical protein